MKTVLFSFSLTCFLSLPLSLSVELSKVESSCEHPRERKRDRMRTRTLSQMICSACRFFQQSIGLIPMNNSLVLFFFSSISHRRRRSRPTMRLTCDEHKNCHQ